MSIDKVFLKADRGASFRKIYITYITIRREMVGHNYHNGKNGHNYRYGIIQYGIEYGQYGCIFKEVQKFGLAMKTVCKMKQE